MVAKGVQEVCEQGHVATDSREGRAIRQMAKGECFFFVGQFGENYLTQNGDCLVVFVWALIS